jgi:hypothetical protein
MLAAAIVQEITELLGNPVSYGDGQAATPIVQIIEAVLP